MTPSGPVSEQAPADDASQKASLMHPQGPSRLGEQKPNLPQSASTRQLLAVAHVLADVSELELRQRQGAFPTQSESLAHSS